MSYFCISVFSSFLWQICELLCKIWQSPLKTWVLIDTEILGSDISILIMYEYKRINIPLLFSILVIIITSVNLWRLWLYSEYDSDLWWCLNTFLRAKKFTVINFRSESPLWTAVCPSLTHSFIHSVRHSVVQPGFFSRLKLSLCRKLYFYLILYLMMNKIIVVLLTCWLSHYFSFRLLICLYSCQFLSMPVFLFFFNFAPMDNLSLFVIFFIESIIPWPLPAPGN